MEKNEKTSLKEAITDYKEIVSAADAKAKKRLAEEFPEKFKNMLKEELNNNKSAKESYKKIDEAKESIKVDKPELNENDMKKDEKETKKVVNEAKDEKETKEVVNEAKEQPVDSDTPNVGDDEVFTEKPKTKRELKEDVEDLSDLPDSVVGTALENANESDEFDVIDLKAIEDEIAEMEELGEELKGINDDSPSYMKKDSGGIAFSELVNLRNKLDEVIKNLEVDEQKKYGGKQDYKGREDGGPTGDMIEEEPVGEQKMNTGKQDFAKREEMGTSRNLAPDGKMIDEQPELSPEEIDAALDAVPDEVEEGLGITHARRKGVDAGLNPDHYPDRRRYHFHENEKKFKSLLEENKKLTKKVNELKEYKEKAGGLLENYNSALEKYRTQLKEMAVFNTNLAHVNNILINEELILTQDDKVKVISEFKNVASISESQTKYKKLLSEMKESKETISESIEKKVANSIQPSTKENIKEEVVEKTAYENDSHINKMKKLIEYVENRGKNKKII